MSWTARGHDGNGSIQAAPDGHTLFAPTVATHNGELWCIWSDPVGEIFYAIGNNDTFGARIPFHDHGIPAMTELAGRLHTIVARETGDVLHYVFEDVAKTWTPLSIVSFAAGSSIRSIPAIISWRDKLVLVFIRNSTLFYSLWTPNEAENGTTWTTSWKVTDTHQAYGIPAILDFRGILYVICNVDPSTQKVLAFAYDSNFNAWNVCDNFSDIVAYVGLSATTFGDSTFFAFQENRSGDSRRLYLREHKNGQWRTQESVAGQRSADPPQLAVLNGRLNCFFNANDEAKGLRWYSRQLLDYSLSSWMGEISDDNLLSNITCPGTHDSCAKSAIPYVQTQSLPITKQLEAGIRFFDFRCRLRDDELYLYHGGVPLNLPKYLKLDSVMEEIFTFFMKDTPIPTETALISIDNDDHSRDYPHALFYSAVASHILSTPPYSSTSSRWITSPHPRTLGSVRGKAILLRRFPCNPSLPPSSRIGIDLSRWVNNSPSFTLSPPRGPKVHIQDRWQFTKLQPLSSLIITKLVYVTNMLRAAAEGGRGDWYINFTSAVGDPAENGELADPRWIAVGARTGFAGRWTEGMNARLGREFSWESGKRYGVVVMDFPELPKESDLIAKLVSMNM